MWLDWDGIFWGYMFSYGSLTYIFIPMPYTLYPCRLSPPSFLPLSYLVVLHTVHESGKVSGTQVVTHQHVSIQSLKDNSTKAASAAGIQIQKREQKSGAQKGVHQP